MLFASVTDGASGRQAAELFERSDVKGAPGVRHLAARDRWVAVVADSWWAAERALKASAPFSRAIDRPPTFGPSSKKRSPRATPDDGSAAAIMMDRSVDRGPLAATYYAAPSQHLGLEPLTRDRAASGNVCRDLDARAGTGPCAGRLTARCFIQCRRVNLWASHGSRRGSDCGRARARN